MNQKLSASRPIVRLALNRNEVAMSIGVSPDSVDKMVAEGYLPRPRVWHTRKLWIVSEIESALYNLDTDVASDDDGLDDWSVAPPVDVVPTSKKPARDARNKSSDADDYALYLSLPHNEFMKIMEQRYEDKMSKVPGQPLQKREVDTLRLLAAAGINVAVKARELRPCRSDVAARLLVRGFIGESERSDPNRAPEHYWITEAGLLAWTQAVNEGIAN